MKNAEDFDNSDLSFQPEMCHQIYGDNENIFGYKGLKVSCNQHKLYLQKSRKHCILHLKELNYIMTVKAQYND